MLVIIIAIFALTGFPDTIKTKITGAETHRGSFLIFTEHGTYKNQDNWAYLKWDSSDLQGTAILLTGKEVSIRKIGWRNGLFSMHENVTSITKVIKGE